MGNEHALSVPVTGCFERSATATSDQQQLESGSNPSSTPRSNPKKERTIQRMDKAIRRRVRGGITYNMKLLVRGAKGTGKTSLFQRLKGEPIPDTHQSTPQLQSATIKWSFRQHLEENVKCEVWDVVDKGFVPVETDEGAEEDSTRTQNASAEHGGLQSGGAIVDASTVDVYHEAHGVIFLLDVTKWDTLEYVKQQLDNVPVHIPTLVLGNFRDQGAQRKIFKEDIQELLYGSSDRPQPQQWRRPMELLYFECSLLNCYGLKSLHQYFGIPFLQLKLATIRQQMRIVEGEFTHLKHDVQATISEQRYADYVEHIKATGSDIRTGRRGSGNENTPPAASRSNLVRLSPKESDQTKSTTQRDGADDDVPKVRVSDLDHFYSESESDEDVGDDDEVVVVAPVDRSMGGVSHKQRFIDSDSSDSDEVESAGSRLIQQERAPRKSSPRRSAIKQATRVESSTSVDDPQAVPREASPKQRQSSSPVRVVTQIPPVAPSTPPSASPMRHSSPRNKSDNPVVQTHDETRESLSQGGGEVKQETSSSEEPGLPGTEVVVESISPRVQESLSISTKHEISKSPVASTRASSEDETEDADIIDSVTTHTAINKELDASILPVKEVPLLLRMTPTESEGASADGDMDGLDDVAASSNELNTFLADDDSDGGDDDDNALAAPQENVVKAEEPVVSKALLPMYSPAMAAMMRIHPIGMNQSIYRYLRCKRLYRCLRLQRIHSLPLCQRNHDEAGDLLSLSSLQASLPLPGEATAPMSTLSDTNNVPVGHANGANDSSTNAALRLSDLQTSPSKALASKAIVPDFATVVPSNDLEDFLNESDSDSENAPPTYAEPQSSRQGSRRAMVESSDDDDEEDLDRFESYSISKKNRSERRRQQKEDLRQLNAALDLDNDPFAPSMSAVAVSDSSFGSSDVMEAIRKAQEEAMRMLPTDHAPADDADSASSKKKHRHKHKKEQKHKKRTAKSAIQMSSDLTGSFTMICFFDNGELRVQDEWPTTTRTSRSCKTSRRDAKATKHRAQRLLKSEPEVEQDSDEEADNQDEVEQEASVALQDEVLVMQMEIETLQRQRLLLDSAVVNARTNAVTHAIDLTKGFYVHFSNGYDPGVDLFLNQYKMATQGHGSMRVFVHDIIVINEDLSSKDSSIQILAKATARFRVSRTTLEKFFRVLLTMKSWLNSYRQGVRYPI
ncbi:P-loop containing nucleoside triphosphate hydrolase [Phytophthora cactorum]|nr:P-loop containing nucleoside triphosphate hydrolase [Phytophthora cactorum]